MNDLDLGPRDSGLGTSVLSLPTLAAMSSMAVVMRLRFCRRNLYLYRQRVPDLQRTLAVSLVGLVRKP
jgi:hypothetical protein